MATAKKPKPETPPIDYKRMFDVVRFNDVPHRCRIICIADWGAVRVAGISLLKEIEALEEDLLEPLKKIRGQVYRFIPDELLDSSEEKIVEFLNS